jgi:hypothetical protein
MLVDVEKNENEELPVPTAWRSTLCDIVESFKSNNFQLTDVPNVKPIDPELAGIIRDSILYYGDALTSLPSETWETSRCIWMLEYWEVLVDLFTANQGRSDLTLFVNVFEVDDGFEFEVKSVHVP